MVSAAKRQEILAAASKHFAHYGYDKTTLDDIGRLTGLNKASLYYYFKSKDDIYAEVIGFEINEGVRESFAAAAREKGCRARIMTYLVERLRFSRKTLNVHRLTCDQGGKRCPRVDAFCVKLTALDVENVGRILQWSRDEGETVAHDCERVARSIVTVVYAINSKARQSDESGPGTVADFDLMMAEIVFTLSLILDGLVDPGHQDSKRSNQKSQTEAIK
jgi:AcrR family transcriptional regulator